MKTKAKLFVIAVTAVISIGVFTPKIITATNAPLETEQNIPKKTESLYKSNSSSDKSKFISKETALGKIKINDDGKLISSELKSWDTYSRDVLEKPNSMSQIENDRMVWVVTVDYPNGIDTRGGYFNQAKQITVFDAETGQILNVTTLGDSPSKEHKKSK